MPWQVRFHPDFYKKFYELGPDVQTKILAMARLLKDFGPNLSRPYVDTLKGSQFSNLKELRCDAVGGVWRIAFAFYPLRQAVLLTA